MRARLATVLIYCLVQSNNLVLAQISDTSCSRTPEFTRKRGISKPLVSTSNRMRVGLLIYPVGEDGSLGTPLQLPSWRSAGQLGAFVADQEGNIFVVPVPNVNTLENPPEKQNWIYKVSSNDGELRLFTKIPVETAPSQQNPYGLLGLAYDCSRKLLYATTVSGSSKKLERGKVLVIDAQNGSIVSELKNIDAIGIGLGAESGVRYAYLGKARSSEIVRIKLNFDGSFAVDKAEFVLRLDPFDVLRARKIRLSSDRMTVSTTEFYFNLVAQTEFEQPTQNYIVRDGKWEENIGTPSNLLGLTN